jgi:hypothetical protein
MSQWGKQRTLVNAITGFRECSNRKRAKTDSELVEGFLHHHVSNVGVVESVKANEKNLLGLTTTHDAECIPGDDWMGDDRTIVIKGQRAALHSIANVTMALHRDAK